MLSSIVAGVILMLMGIARLGRLSALVPHSIVVGFTIGIAITIALSQIGEVLGIKASLGYDFVDKIQASGRNLGGRERLGGRARPGYFSHHEVPAQSRSTSRRRSSRSGWRPPCRDGLDGQGLTLVKDKYGRIPTDFWVLTPPTVIEMTPAVLWDLFYFVVAIVFVAAIESLLCSRMADRLAENRGGLSTRTRSSGGRGWSTSWCPCSTGSRTPARWRGRRRTSSSARSRRSRASSSFLKLFLAFYLASYLELVPMACIGGILLYVAYGMVKPAEVAQVLAHNKFHVGLMVYTAVMVVVTDFLTGVLSAISVYAVGYFIGKRIEVKQEKKAPGPAYSQTGD